jgi:hypothetical protein
MYICINLYKYYKDYNISNPSKQVNNIRSFIKKESIELSDITKFLKNFIIKIIYINSLFQIDHSLLKNSNTLLNNLIIDE